jgi:hypothetical protein
MAYERVHGPILIHERTERALIVLTYYMVNLWSRKPVKIEKFLPPWYEAGTSDPLEGFKKLMRIAEANPAND